MLLKPPCYLSRHAIEAAMLLKPPCYLSRHAIEAAMLLKHPIMAKLLIDLF
jgi:hypothetical protein